MLQALMSRFTQRPPHLVLTSTVPWFLTSIVSIFVSNKGGGNTWWVTLKYFSRGVHSNFLRTPMVGGEWVKSVGFGVFLVLNERFLVVQKLFDLNLVCDIWILRHMVIFWHKMFEFGADILIFGAKISKSCFFKVNRRGARWSGDLREVSASVSGKNIPDTPWYFSVD